MRRRAPLASLAPPDWLVRSLRPQPAPVPWAAVARAAVAIALPLAIGTAVGHPAYGALASMGALSGVIGDTADAYRMRILNIAVPQLFGALGVTLGSLAHGHGWAAVAAVTVIALVSGMMSTIGAVASVSGLLLLLNAVIGAGLPLPGAWWLAPALMTGGGLLVLVLALLAWPLRSGVPERAAVAAAYRKVAALLEAAGTEHTGEDAYDEARAAVTAQLNQAYDLVLARRARDHGRSPDLVRLIAVLNAITPVVEAAPVAHQYGEELPPELPEAARGLAAAIARGPDDEPVALGLPAELPEAYGAAARAVHQALRHAADTLADPDPLTAVHADDRLGRPAALRVRARRATRNVMLSGASWRYGLRLALCIGIAQSLVSLIDVPRSYWVALTVTFVLKPDFGSVFSRAVMRALGTAAGLVVAAAVLSAVDRGWWDVPVVLVLATLIPALTPRGYGYQTAAITPVILLLSDVLNHQGFGLVLPRLLDSLIGCAIALVAGYLLWPESWHTRIGDRLADAVADTAEYVECAFGQDGSGGDPAARARMRRRLYRDLSDIRTEFQRALTEPPPMGARAAAWWPLVVAVERIADATTAARVRIRHGASAPEGAEAGEVVRQLRELAAALREVEVLVPVPVEFTGPKDSVLEPLRQEVAAARAIASPRP
ncbi:FUSC family protein [Streptomyces spectabilis]|uniref:FUSC family protein n=1 Tax=Streptomyces spectabilis TaxID=68270 RepID=A0A5P2X9J9_STRST|nr:FUSC family protein [Streptomyces spectabilis]MBB5103818.1 putative membrane protein YccC [Streptomyces spectabilis]MCI3903944.1 FUSC family protein [Streptomyces spectabilis]QEV61101.1 FUSC family protein [Streptomyces spectabilis]GGV18592.1 membrane protein [Streptomyces spectabilis]